MTWNSAGPVQSLAEHSTGIHSGPMFLCPGDTERKKRPRPTTEETQPDREKEKRNKLVKK